MSNENIEKEIAEYRSAWISFYEDAYEREEKIRKEVKNKA